MGGICRISLMWHRSWIWSEDGRPGVDWRRGREMAARTLPEDACTAPYVPVTEYKKP